MMERVVVWRKGYAFYLIVVFVDLVVNASLITDVECAENTVMALLIAGKHRQ